jgi:hypothetical protein
VQVQFEELRFITQQAAIDVAGRHPRPLPPTVVLPGPARTLLLALPELPLEDEMRHLVFAEIATDHLTGEGIPCWGFVAEADVAGREAVVAVFGARRHVPHVSAAWFGADGQLEEFVRAEELDPAALPYLHPLQHAVDALPGAQSVFDAYDPKRAQGPQERPDMPGLPMHPDA